MRVRWALEETGQPYDVRLVTFAQMKQPAHLARQPFGQIPTYQEGDVELFVSGTIVLHIAERHPALLSQAPAPRALSWLFTALDTVESPILGRETVRFFEADKPYQAEHLAMVGARLDQLAAALGDADWLAGLQCRRYRVGSCNPEAGGRRHIGRLPAP